MIVGIVSFFFVFSFGGKDYVWGLWQIIGFFVFVFVGIVGFVFVEIKVKELIFLMYLFKNRMFIVLNLIGFFMSIGMFGVVMFVFFFMQGIIGVSVIVFGMIMMLMMVFMIIISIIGGQLVYKIGIKL